MNFETKIKSRLNRILIACDVALENITVGGIWTWIKNVNLNFNVDFIKGYFIHSCSVLGLTSVLSFLFT